MNMITEENGFNPDIFNEAQGMMKKRFGEMVGYYIEDVQTYLGEIRTGLEARDAKKIYPAAHTIKSSSKQLGIMKVSDIAKDIELSGRALAEGGEAGGNNFESIAARARQLEESFAKAEAALKDFLAKQLAA